MGDNSQSTIQWGVGILCAMIMAYMLYISGGPNRSYDIVAILGMLTLIAILLGYQELVIKVLQVWRGNSPDLSVASSDGDGGGGGDGDENGDGNGRSDEERGEITRQILKDIRREQRDRARQHAKESEKKDGETEAVEE